MIRWLFAVLHLLALGIGLGAIWTRAGALRQLGRGGSLRAVFTADTWWVVALTLWLLTGLVRVIAGLERPGAYYMHNPLFWTKMVLASAVYVIELWRMAILIQWGLWLGKGRPLDTAVASRLAVMSYAQFGAPPWHPAPGGSPGPGRRRAHVTRMPTKPAFPVARVLAAYRGMLPWMLLLWLLAALLPGPGGAQFLVVIGLSPFMLAAAARGLGLHPDRSVAALAVERAFTHLTSLLPLLLFVALAAAIGGTLGAMIADALGLPDPRLASVPLASLVALPILWWHWPAAVLAYMAPDDAGYRRPGGRTWRGPRYSDARTLARVAGASRRTALLLAFLCLWIIMLVTTHDYRGDIPIPTLVQAASYLAFLPLLLAMGAVEARRMVVSAGGS